MRIISQSGRIDIPYEVAVVYVEYESVIAKVGDERYAMGNYSTEEKAFKAMEMLMERHTDNVFCREDIQYKAEIMLDDGLQIVREMMMKCEYFQFPQDDEMEV